MNAKLSILPFHIILVLFGQILFQFNILPQFFIQLAILRKYSVFEFSDVLPQFLYLLLFCYKLFGKIVYIISSFVLLHNIKHMLKALPKFLILFGDSYFFFVSVN